MELKYMTKEWYETCQKTDCYFSLKVSKQAESFSEDYFKTLYKKEEAAWLKSQEEMSNLSIEEIYPYEFIAENIDGSPLEPEEFEKAKKEYFEMREQAWLEYDDNRPVFDPEQEKKTFKQALRYNIKWLKTNLPDEILRNVADIRVLALDRASAAIKKEITAFCKANNKVMKSALEAYWKEHKKRFRHNEPSFLEMFNFHDCIVISCRKKGTDLIITLDNSGGFTNINQIVFKNCIIMKQDKPLYGAWWLYDEIYFSDRGYEIHALLLGKSGNELLDFIVDVTDVEYKTDGI